MACIPTVKIVADTRYGYKIINEIDFNPATMDLYEGSPSEAHVDPPLTSPTEGQAEAASPSFVHVEFDDDMEGDMPPDPPSDEDLVAAVEYCMDPEHPDRMTAAGKPQTDKMSRFLSERLGREVKVSSKVRDAAMALYIETKEA